MIISKFSNTLTNNRNYKKFIKFGYNFKIGDDILVDVDHLSKSSRSIVEVECDFCGLVKELKYYIYISNIEKHNTYSCGGKCKMSKYRETNRKRFGSDYPLQNIKIKKNLENYFMSKFGVKHPSMLEEFELKKQSTNLNRYGVRHQMYIDNNLKKIKENKLEKYGDVNYNNLEKSKETKLQKYGDSNYNNHDKYVNTCLERYGVNNNMKVFELFKKNQKSRYLVKLNEDTNLYYQGTYELDFINFCIRNNIKIDEGIVIDYTMNNKSRKYYSDFFIEEYNLICEIKSSYTYNMNHEENILKMKSSIDSGYNFLFIVDKNYSDLEKIINRNGINSTL